MRRGRVVAVQFQEVPDQAPLVGSGTDQSASDLSFETRAAALADELDVDIEADGVVSHDTEHAITNFADRRGVKTIVAEHEPLRLRSRVVGAPIDWVVRQAPCDVLLVDNLRYDSPQQVVVSGHGSPYSPVTVDVAGTIAAAKSGRLSLWYPADVDGSDPHAATIDDSRSELASILSIPVSTESIRTGGGAALLTGRGGQTRLRRSAPGRRARRSARCAEPWMYGGHGVPPRTPTPATPHRLFERVTFRARRRPNTTPLPVVPAVVRPADGSSVPLLSRGSGPPGTARVDPQTRSRQRRNLV